MIPISVENVQLLYKDEDPRVIEYMELIVEDLEQQYGVGNIPDYLKISLDMFAQELLLYFLAKDDFKKDIYSTIKSGGKIFRNPVIQLLHDTTKNIQRMATDLGLTIFSKQKLEVLKKKTNNSDAAAKELLKNMLS